jgi:hypothetical protein
MRHGRVSLPIARRLLRCGTHPALPGFTGSFAEYTGVMKKLEALDKRFKIRA